MGLGPSSRFPWLKLAAAGVALGLHAAVLAMILSAPVAQVALGQPDALDVQFVELGSVVEPAPAAKPASASPEARTVDHPTEPDPVVEPEPGVEPEVKPVVEAPPEPVVDEPEPESITEAPPPKPQPEPKPKSKPEPRPKPRPAPKPQPEAQPQSGTAGQPADSKASKDAQSGGAPQSAQAHGESRAVDPDRPRVIGQVDYLGKRPSPAYPRVSQRRGEQGRVVLRVLISPEGHVAQVKVQRSSGYERLDEAAAQAMRQARFRPYTENGIAYKALVDIPFDFVL
ncbi:TonB family protein [Castellaniella sp. MT123]|uniref:energy transducer TonB n=1 Tax=Castellaniella sp. MT123 TaxID=3140381 RepID=UPI0031F3F86D